MFPCSLPKLLKQFNFFLVFNFVHLSNLIYSLHLQDMYAYCIISKPLYVCIYMHMYYSMIFIIILIDSLQWLTDGYCGPHVISPLAAVRMNAPVSFAFRGRRVSIRKTRFCVAEMLHTGEYMKFNMKYSQRAHVW